MMLVAEPAMTQVPATKPAKPTVAKPVAPTPPAVQRAKPASPAKVATLRNELKSVDLELARLKPDNGGGKDAIGKMAAEDAAYMEVLMKKKGDLEKLISDLMKSGGETGTAIVGNAKDS
jgi:hypothetical protein